MQQQPAAPTDPALWLYRPPPEECPADGSQTDQLEPSPSWTLTQFWHHFARPGKMARNAAPRYLRALEQSVHLWAQATGDPPLKHLDDRDCDRFLTQIGEGLSPNTVRKHARHVQHLLDWAGPRSRSNRRPPADDGLYGDDQRGRPRPAPYIEPPCEQYNGPRPGWTVAEMDAILAACPSATRPRYAADRTLWWRAFFTFAWNTGLRAESATLFAPAHRDGEWANLPAAIMKRRRHGHRLYLNRHARAALNLVEPPDPATPYFAWPGSYSWFYATVREISQQALPVDRQLGTHACRRSLITWLMQRNPAVAKLMAGHCGRDVTLRHYTAPEIVCELVEAYPQPTGWTPHNLS